MDMSIVGLDERNTSMFCGLLLQVVEIRSISQYYAFGFNLLPEASSKIQSIYDCMITNKNYSKLPTSNGITFSMFFKPKVLNKLIHVTKGKKGFDNERTPDGFLKVQTSFWNPTIPEVDSFLLKNKTNDRIESMFNSDIVVLLIDSSLFLGDSKGDISNEAIRQNNAMKTVVDGLLHYRSKKRIRNAIYPIMFFINADGTCDEIKQRFLADNRFDYNERESQKIGNELMKTYCSGILSSLKTASKLKLPVRRIQYYFSWIDRAHSLSDEKTLKVRLDRNGFSNIFSLHMYDAFLDYIDQVCI